MKTAKNKKDWSFSIKQSNLFSGYKKLSHRMKQTKDNWQNKKNKSKRDNSNQNNRSDDLHDDQNKISSILSRTFNVSKISVDKKKTSRKLLHSFTALKLTDEQRKLIKDRKFTPSEVTFDLQNNNTNSSYELESFANEQGNKVSKSHSDLPISLKLKNQFVSFHKRISPQYTAQVL